MRTGIIAALVVAAAAAVQLGLNRMPGRPGDRTLDRPAIAHPTRRPPDAPPPAPPAVPEEVDRLAPLTLDLSIQTTGAGGAVRRVRQTIARTSDRVHVQTIDGPEWYFERNPRDRRRAAGFLVDHEASTIVLYSETHLRIELGIAGWAPVVTLGIDPDVLGTLDRSREVRTVAGLQFVRYTAPGTRAVDSEIWWNSEHVLPAAAVSRGTDREVRLVVQHLRTGVDPRLLQHPARRFPGYRQIDVADRRERH